MRQNNVMYGGPYDLVHRYNASLGDGSIIMPQPSSGYRQPFNQMYAGSSYSSTCLQPIQPQPTPQPLLLQQYPPENTGSQIRRLSSPAVRIAAFSNQQFDDAEGSGDSFFVDTSQPAVAVPNVAQAQTYSSQSQKQFISAQSYPLRRTLNMRNGFGMNAYAAPSQQQANQGASPSSMQSRGSFRCSSNGYDGGVLQRIDSGFDSRPNTSFRGVGVLQRQLSTLGGVPEFYPYGSQVNMDDTGETLTYSGNNNISGSGSEGAAMQRGGTGGSSLYRMYSFSDANNGGALSRGLSSYGSLYGGQNMYGDGSERGSGTNLYGTMSSGNLQHTYSFTGSVIQEHGSGFGLLDAAAEENEFGGSTASSANCWNNTGRFEYDVPQNTYMSPLLPITPSAHTPNTAQRPRRHSAPASLPAYQQSASSSSTARTRNGQRTRRQGRPKRTESEEEQLQGHNCATSTTYGEESPPTSRWTQGPQESPQQNLPRTVSPKEEEVLVPIRRRASTPVNLARSPATPFEQMRALRRAQTSAYRAPLSPAPPLSSSMIGRRRGASGGLFFFSGAAVV